MEPGDKESDELLKQARAKAHKLIEGIEKAIADTEANPPDISAEDREQGRYALQKALEAAQRMLKSLDEAQKIAAVPNN